MAKVVKVSVLPNYTLALTFDDGLRGEVSLADRLFGPMFEPLKDPAFFARASIDAYGAVCWPNDVDLAPDALHRKVAGNRVFT